MKQEIFSGELVKSQRILYTPSEFARNSLIHLQEIGTLKAQKPHTSKRKNLSSYLFFIVESGAGTLVYDNTTYLLKTGNCIFIDCQKSYSHESSPDLWELKWIHFYGPTMPNVYNKYEERGGLPIFHPDDILSYLVIWEKLYTTANSTDPIRDMRINEGLTSLLTHLMGESSPQTTSHAIGTKKQLIFEIKSYLEDHYSEKITLDQLAEMFFINKYYLTRIFKDQFGTSINNYLLQIRISHAKRLLRFTEKSIEEVGLECGIGNLYYFSRTFHNVEGISPREYRKRW